MIRNDVYWKGLIENLFPHFIPFFLPQYTTLFDLTRPVEFLDKELQQLYAAMGLSSTTRFVDKLVKVFTTSGQEQWVLIHIEVQGYSDKDFAQRMHQYFYRILDRYGVAITAIAIFTDNNPSFQPVCLSVCRYRNDIPLQYLQSTTAGGRAVIAKQQPVCHGHLNSTISIEEEQAGR